MQSKATTVAQYLAGLPADRRATIEAVRAVILKNLDSEYEEGMQYGMIGYYVPHSVYPPGYHCDPKQPLPFAALASQKHYMSIYLMSVYGDPKAESAFRAAWAKTGKKLDELALDLIGDIIRSMPARKRIALYEAMLNAPRPKPAAKQKAAKKK